MGRASAGSTPSRARHPGVHPGKQVSVRWVLVRDVAGEFEPQAFACMDQADAPVTILQLFVRCWTVEVTIAEVRGHLALKT